jgi:tetratricopeptide (TPR) repeat protein
LNGDLPGAEALLRKCLETNRKTRGEIHPNTSATLHYLALIAAARQDRAGAEAILRHSLDISRKTLGEKHPVVARTLNSLSHVLAAQGRSQEAAAALQDAMAIARPALGGDHQLVAIYAINLASVQLARNQAVAAEELLREALPIRARAPGLVPSRRGTISEDDWSVATTKALLGTALVAQPLRRCRSRAARCAPGAGLTAAAGGPRRHRATTALSEVGGEGHGASRCRVSGAHRAS